MATHNYDSITILEPSDAAKRNEATLIEILISPPHGSKTFSYMRFVDIDAPYSAKMAEFIAEAVLAAMEKARD